jgi:hypothetical protein
MLRPTAMTRLCDRSSRSARPRNAEYPAQAGHGFADQYEFGPDILMRLTKGLPLP